MNGCVSVPRVAASGEVAGYSLHGPVDSALARDYLSGSPLPSSLRQLRRRYLASGKVPSREELARIAQGYSPDVATLLFLETLSALPDVRILRERYEAELSYVRSVGVDRAKPETPDDLLVLMIPSWFYIAHGQETNADYRIQRKVLERWGLPYRLAPLKENGTVEENARIVAREIRRLSRTHKLLLVSASKSGAEVAQALGRELEPSETRSVVAWLSVVGALRGSPLADRAFKADLCWIINFQLGLEGFDLEGLRSMQASRARRAFGVLHLPQHIRTFVYMAVPLSGHISKRGSFGYGQLRDFGPNDGLTLLADELLPHSVPLLAPGTDHFLSHSQELWSTAVFRVLIEDVRKAVRTMDGPGTDSDSCDARRGDGTGVVSSTRPGGR